MPQINVKPEQLAILQDILKNHPECYVYGSRVKGTHKEYSDLDLCFIREGEVDVQEIADLREKFEESNLPFTVDIVDYQKLSPGFREIIDRDKVGFPYGGKE